MTISATGLIQRAATLLVDLQKRRWPESTLLTWGNDGQLAIVALRPDAYTQTQVVQLQVGTRQSLPPGAFSLLDVSRNMGTNGETPGGACLYVDRKRLDNEDPLWHTAPASAVVLQWMYDRSIPKTWWCYPPQPTSNQGYVELDVSTAPPAMTIDGVAGATVTVDSALDDVYVNPLLEFMIYRAHSEDAEYASSGKAEMFYDSFLRMLGLKTETDKRFRAGRNQQPRYDAPPKSDLQGAFGEP